MEKKGGGGDRPTAAEGGGGKRVDAKGMKAPALPAAAASASASAAVAHVVHKVCKRNRDTDVFLFPRSIKNTSNQYQRYQYNMWRALFGSSHMIVVWCGPNK